jgi:type VII secretion protein EccB
MQLRRDQVQAYFYHIGRLLAAVMHGKPDTPEPPNRRPLFGLFVGLLIAGVIAGGFGIYGVFRPGGGGNWRQAGVIIIVKETGARYLYLDNQLRPVLNYTSARLALNNPGAAVVTVSRNSIASVPVGAPIGIPGAPDSLPVPQHMLSTPWTVCAQTAAGPGATTSTLMLSAPAEQELGADEGFYVATPDGQRYLVWQGHRYRIGTPAAAAALGYSTATPVPVTPSWVNPIPAGRDLAFPSIAGRGAHGPVIGGVATTVGQVYEVMNPATGASQLYLARADGFVRLSTTAAALILADPAVKQAYGAKPVGAVTVGAAELDQSQVLATTEFVDGLPPKPPRPAAVGDGMAACVKYTFNSAGLAVSVTRTAGTAMQSAAQVPRATDDGATANRIVMSAGTGVLARTVTAPGAAPGALFLVTEMGVKFPISDDGAAGALGFGGAAAVPVPNELLATIPTGPVLSPAAALATQTWGD